MEINYVGEHLVWGQLGHFFIVLSFVGALLSALSYWFAAKNSVLQSSGGAGTASAVFNDWKRLGRLGFNLHTTGVLGIIFTLFYILFNHYFEYQYVWQHSNRDMPMEYILSCFWEGQEGSFLLWSFWNMVLGQILIRSANDWEASTLWVVALVQVFLASMLLGVYIGDLRIGSNPFILLREHPDFRNLPFVQSANYLQNLDGRGLNPLLQNYWMTIHPPTLFLGFSAVLFPFAYAMGGILRRKYTEWIKPALPWTFFGIAILGAGILMGGAWAYEALSFGGFWAWDPVENASLVPWLTLVGAGHVMLINRNKAQSVPAGYFLVIISFVLVLYSTFLTRSGILGETSVHAFTDLGMSGQLLIYMLFFTWLPSAIALKPGSFRNVYIPLSIIILAAGLTGGFFKLITLLFLAYSLYLTIRTISRDLAFQAEEEHVSSREFWMFIGALVLLISSFQIIFSTSTPVINKVIRGTLQGFFAWLNGVFPGDIFKKLADANMGLQQDVIEHYNGWQIPFAIVVALLMAVGQFLKYRKTPGKELFKKISLSAIVSIALTIVLALVLELREIPLIFLMLASLFAVTANLDYFFRVIKGKVSSGGASIAHVGFGLLILGALISAGKKEFISQNNTAVDLGKDFPNRENILLSKNDTVRMGEYLVSYRGDSTAGINIYYNIDYFRVKDGQPVKEFTLSPLVQLNPRMGNVAEPATRHYLHKDVFTHVTYAQLEKKEDGWKEPVDAEMRVGDTAYSNTRMVVLEDIDRNPEPHSEIQQGDLAVAAVLKVLNINGSVQTVKPLFVIRGNSSLTIPAELESPEIRFSFYKIDPARETFHIRIHEKESTGDDFIILKAIVFPGINILWIGCILLVLGTGIAVWSRVKKQQKSSVR